MANQDLRKSTRHSKIAGDYGEYLILYELSRQGYECARVDHTGIDIIARHPSKSQVMGISVKTRTRDLKTKEDTLNISRSEIPKVDFACQAFKCQPYFALIIDQVDIIRGFLLSKKLLLKYGGSGQKVLAWKMSDSWIKEYETNNSIQKISFTR